MKYLVYTAMALLFAGAMYLIFAPSAEEKEDRKKGAGLMTEVPAPTQHEMAVDKRTAYEQEEAYRIRQERMQTPEDFMSMIQEDGVSAEDDGLLLSDAGTERNPPAARGGSAARPAARSSAVAYRDMNRTLETFYEQPAEDERVNRLTGEVEALKRELESRPQGAAVEEQMALMEESYRMAAKYMGTGGTAGTASTAAASPAGDADRLPVTPVAAIRGHEVSALSPPASDAEFIESYGTERNLTFFSPETALAPAPGNTIRACIHGDQTVSDGAEVQRSVRLRLTEPVSAGGTVIPANTILTGQARIGERLDVTVTSVEYLGRIYATEIYVYDTDGQKGIAIPPSLETNAVREVAANTGSGMGTSITFSQNAKQQIAADLGRGVIQGTSQYIARKMRVVKVHLKAGHRVFLVPKNN